MRGTDADPQFLRAVAAIQPEVIARRSNDNVIASPAMSPQRPSQLGRIEP